MNAGGRLDGFLPDAAATDRLGRALAPVLRPGDALCLIGALGAGKSALARAVIGAMLAAQGREEDMPSPTYTLIQSYRAGGVEILHADLYRLADESEAAELGLDEETAIRLIEWPERLGALTPARRLELALSIPEDGRGRRLAARFHGPDWDAARRAVAAALAGAEAAP